MMATKTASNPMNMKDLATRLANGALREEEVAGEQSEEDLHRRMPDDPRRLRQGRIGPANVPEREINGQRRRDQGPEDHGRRRARPDAGMGPVQPEVRGQPAP